MNLLAPTLAAYGGAILLSLSPWSAANAAQPDMAPAPSMASQDMTPAPAVAHGDWTLKQREDWLSDKLDKSRGDGSLDKIQYDRAHRDMSDLRHEESRMRDAAHGELTDNQTADLEVRLDAMAAKIKWANANAYAQPW
jgi:hypothetical protein